MKQVDNLCFSEILSNHTIWKGLAMLAAFAKQPLYGKRLDVSAVPDGVVHKIEFNDLALISAGDFVWIIAGQQFVCCQVRSSVRHIPRDSLGVISFVIEYGHPHGSARHTVEMGQETSLFYIDPFFLHRHFSEPTHIPSAEIVQLKDKRGGG